MRRAALAVLLLAVALALLVRRYPPLPAHPIGSVFRGESHVFGHNGGGDRVPANLLESIRSVLTSAVLGGAHGSVAKC